MTYTLHRTDNNDTVKCHRWELRKEEEKKNQLLDLYIHISHEYACTFSCMRIFDMFLKKTYKPDMNKMNRSRNDCITTANNKIETVTKDDERKKEKHKCNKVCEDICIE